MSNLAHDEQCNEAILKAQLVNPLLTFVDKFSKQSEKLESCKLEIFKACIRTIRILSSRNGNKVVVTSSSNECNKGPSVFNLGPESFVVLAGVLSINNFKELGEDSTVDIFRTLSYLSDKLRNANASIIREVSYIDWTFA